MEAYLYRLAVCVWTLILKVTLKSTFARCLTVRAVFSHKSLVSVQLLGQVFGAKSKSLLAGNELNLKRWGKYRAE
jgi:hypothetical protein